MFSGVEPIRLLVLGRRLGHGRGRMVREAADLSLRDLAATVGVSVAALSRWERGEERPSRAAAVRWACAITDIEAALAESVDGGAVSRPVPKDVTREPNPSRDGG